MTHVNGICELCKCRSCVDFVEHFFCVKMCSRREKFWNMVSNQYEIAVEVELHNLSDYDFVNALLGGKIPFFLMLLLSTCTSYKSVLVCGI